MKANELDRIEAGMIIKYSDCEELVTCATPERYYYKWYQGGVYKQDGDYDNNPRSWGSRYSVEFDKSYQFNSLYQKLL